MSALKWWEDAGVDVIVGEEPRDWLKPAPRTPAPAAEPVAVAEPGAPRPTDTGPLPTDDTPLPKDLGAFQDWLLATDRLPQAVAFGGRVRPAGDPASGLMMLIDMPTAEDVAAGTLVSGAVGEMFDRMLARMERSRQTIYLASLSPARSPTGRLTPKDAEILAEIARHHIALAKPKALLLFGDLCSQVLLGKPVAGARRRWHEVATPSGNVRTIATFHPHFLHRQPTQRKDAWEDLQLLMEGLKP